jgi:hypothetical protein
LPLDIRLFSSAKRPGRTSASMSEDGKSPCGGTGASSAAAGTVSRSRYFMITIAPIECPTSTGAVSSASIVSARSST